MNVSYLRLLLGTALLVLALAAVLNLVADPAGIYRDGRVNPQAYASAIIESEYGVWIPDNAFDDRLVSKALARYSDRVECVIIGSSHVMQVSSQSSRRSLERECNSLLNLGVSGAGIEDHFALAYLALQHGRPKRIIFGIDPWTLAYGKDQRWTAYRDDYVHARARIIGKNNDINSRGPDKAELAKLTNLINLEYTLRSARTSIQNFTGGAPTIAPAPDLNPAVGGDHPIQLKDGSHVYSAKYIVDASRIRVPLGGTPYGISGAQNQTHAIDAYRALLLWAKSLGVEPILLLTPYHENVWKLPDSPTAAALRATEPIVAKLASDLNLKLIGSYDPHQVGCRSEEFYDFMHPTADCLARLRMRRIGAAI